MNGCLQAALTGGNAVKRLVTWALVLGVVVAPLTVPGATPSAHAESVAAPAESNDPADLSKFTTETTQVHKLADGTLELTAYRDPVRIKRSGTWVDIDTDLRRADDGRIEPSATASHVSFSAGGSGPLVTMGRDAEKFSIAWDAPLPEPVIDGDAITYPDVRPGTDLVLTATSTGFTQVFVIENEDAAHELVSNPVELTASSPRLRFKPHADGSMQVVDSDGDVVHEGAPPVMWDSRGTAKPTAHDPGEGAIREVVTDVEGSGSEVVTTLAPPADVVSDPATQYPLFLDPTYEQNDNYFRTVHKKGWNYSEAAQPMRVGNCDWAECNDATQGVARSYFQFNVMALRNGFAPSDAKIFDATLAVKQIHNATSSAQPVELRKTSTMPVSWPGTPGALIETKSSAAGGGSNPSAYLNFTNDNMTKYLQSYADGTNDDLLIRFALVAEDESDRNQWKKFDNNPKLTVKYAYAPTVPVLAVEPSHACFGVWSTGASPRLRATSMAIGNTGEISYDFQIDNLETTAVPDFTTTRTKASNSAAEWATTIKHNAKYRFRARSLQYVAGSSGSYQPSAWSSWLEFTVDTVAPAAPEVYSPTHPEGNHWGDATNADTVFKLAGDATEFNWAVDGEPATVPHNNCFASAGGPTARQGTVPAGTDLVLKNLPPGAHDLKVRAVDIARNVSTTKTYRFMVARNVNGPEYHNGINRLEFESLGGTPVNPTTTEVRNDPLSTASGEGSVVITSSASPTAPAVARYTFTAKADATHALGIRYLTSLFGGVFRVALTDPGRDASTADDVTHRFYGDPDGDGDTSEITVATGSPGSTPFGAIKYVNLTDYLAGDGIKLYTNRKYVLDVELITGGGGISQFALLDALVLAPINEDAFTSLEKSFNNQALQHGDTEVAGFELQRSGTRGIAPALSDPQGFKSDSKFVAGDSTFDVPPAQELSAATSPFNQALTKADNTVANGQTIALPEEPTGRYVDLLVTATCMPIDESTSRAITVGVTIENANAPKDFQTPRVPLWLDQNPTGVHHAVEVVPVRAPSDQPKAHLYVLRFDLRSEGIESTDPLTSVTLPNVGTVPGTPCGQVGSQALHVFAMDVKAAPNPEPTSTPLLSRSASD